MAHVRHDRVAKAVIPAAGLGTRFLPATKATPKEMLPVVDKPAIQYVVEEAASAGLSDVLMITGRNKRPLEDHFDHAFELEELLDSKGEHLRLRQVRALNSLVSMHYVRQLEPRGLGDAVLRAERHVADQRFAVLLGDDLIDPRDALLQTMIETQSEFAGSVVALIEVDPSQIHQYGCAVVKPAERDDTINGCQVVQVTDLVEKPERKDAPSNLALVGRYVLDPAVFDVLHATAPGRGGEVQLTDALRVLARRPRERGGPMHGVVFRGRRYDTGDRGEYLRAIVKLAWEREDLGAEFRTWLREFVHERTEA